MVSQLKNAFKRFKHDGFKKAIDYYLSERFTGWQKHRLSVLLLSLAEKYCFRETPRKQMKKQLIIWMNAWGEYVDPMIKYTLPSIFQDGNIPSLQYYGYWVKLKIFLNNDEDRQRVEKYLKTWECEYEIVIVDPKKDRNTFLMGALFETFRECIEKDSYLTLVSPDLVIGNYSLLNTIKLAEGKNVYIAAPYPRADWDKVIESGELNLLTDGGEIQNSELVKILFDHGGEWIYSYFDNVDCNATYGGESIRRISGKLYAVVHNLHSPCIIAPTEKDYKFFQRTRQFNNWDRNFMRFLVRDQRVKFVGSSDCFFAIELTKKDPPKGRTPRRGLLNNDKYLSRKKRSLNNFVSNSMYCIWRKE